MMLKHRKQHVAWLKTGIGLRIEVCWRHDRFGHGPCFSIYEKNREMLRFDLFEVGAHWHTYRQAMQPRVYFYGPLKRTGRFDRLIEDALGVAVAQYPKLVGNASLYQLRTELWSRHKG